MALRRCCSLPIRRALIEAIVAVESLFFVIAHHQAPDGFGIK
jgi:hypothetical protein